MKWSILSQEEAETIANWKYPEEYSFYDMTADQEDYDEFIDPDKRSEHTYSIYDGEELIGFYTIKPTHQNEVDLGLGLKPNRTGRRYGQSFVMEGIEFAQKHYNAEAFTLSVAAFNHRAIKVYQRIGFKEVERFNQETNGSVYEFVRMKKT